MEDKDKIKELFSKKLGNYEAPVNPEIWANVASGVQAATATSTVGGLSFVSKLLIGLASAAIIGTTAYFLTTKKGDSSQQVQEIATVNIPERNEEESTKSIEVNQEKPVKEDHFIGENNSHTNEVNQEKESALESSAETTFEGEEIEQLPVTSQEEIVTEMASYEEEEIEVEEETTQEEQVAESYSEEVEEEWQEENIEVVEEIEEANKPYFKQFTNVFTPNGDGIHDEFSLESRGLTDFSIVVIDRSNRTLFQSNDPDFVWNGYDLSGNLVESGTYIYYIFAKGKNGEPIQGAYSLNVSR